MKEVVLVNLKATGSIYGVGTYMDELTRCLGRMDVKTTLVNIGATLSEFEPREKEGYRELAFPLLSYQHDKNDYYKRVASLLRLYIDDSEDVAFHFNHFSMKPLLEQVKIKFPRAKLVFTVHYLHWSALLQGDVEKFRRLIADGGNKAKKYAGVIRDYSAEKELLENTDAVISLCDDTASLLEEVYGVSREKIFRMDNGLSGGDNLSGKMSREKLRRQFHIGTDEKIVLFVGRLNPVKGIIPLMDCFKRLLKKHDDCRLVLVGDGDYSIFKDYSRIMSKVTVTGRIDKAEVYDWYRIADIGVFPSFYEECSYVGIEMMMHGLPVVASDGYSVRNMFFDRDNALVAREYTDRRAFAANLFEALSELLGSGELRSRLSANSRKTYERKYSDIPMQRAYGELLNGFRQEKQDGER